MSAKQVIEALGGGTFVTAKPGGTGFWGRITGRGPTREPTAPPPPGTAPMATTPPGAAPVAPVADDLDDILEPEAPPVEVEKEEVIALGDAAAEPVVEVDVSKPVPEEPVAAKVEEEKPKLVAKPAAEPVRPSVSFRSMLTLPDPEALPPVPPPPPRPADIFGISPKEAVKSPPRSEKLAPRVPKAEALDPEPESHGSNGSEPPLIAEEVEAGEMPTPPPPQAVEPTEVAAEATIVEAQPKQNRRRSKSSK
jgi:hypothetical protein